MHRPADRWRVFCLGLGLSAVGCSARTVPLVNDTHDAALVDEDAGVIDAGRSDGGVPARCGEVVCACDNGIDDDSDGLTDGFDPECTGASDHDERTFATGTPMGGVPFCQDCFFDSNAGSEDDGCQVHIECVYGREPAMPGGAACFTCDVTKACEDNCRPRTPNGCDCFGCCTVDIKGQPKVNIRLQDSCSLAQLDDEVACPRCVPNDGCRNPCGRCELCPGRTEADLPKDCTDKPMGPGHDCDDREAVCDEATPCAANFYCQQGCCLPVLE